tara:strand:- start:339 stop:464 length:126 start_codon:yes stop_codon:yes gene_type:complete
MVILVVQVEVDLMVELVALETHLQSVQLKGLMVEMETTLLN